jgi:hypothetical protein
MAHQAEQGNYDASKLTRDKDTFFYTSGRICWLGGCLRRVGGAGHVCVDSLHPEVKDFNAVAVGNRGDLGRACG